MPWKITQVYMSPEQRERKSGWEISQFPRLRNCGGRNRKGRNFIKERRVKGASEVGQDGPAPLQPQRASPASCRSHCTSGPHHTLPQVPIKGPQRREHHSAFCPSHAGVLFLMLAGSPPCYVPLPWQAGHLWSHGLLRRNAGSTCRGGSEAASSSPEPLLPGLSMCGPGRTGRTPSPMASTFTFRAGHPASPPNQ